MAHPTTVDGLTLGDHVCWTFQGDDERLEAMARFVSAGLDNGHKVVYGTASLAPEAVLAGLRARGVATEEPARSGQLQARPVAGAFLSTGSFAPEQLLDAYEELMLQAHQEGYSGVRIIGDMAWASRASVSTDELAQFETRANTLFAQGNAVGLCQYDRRQFPAAARAPAGVHLRCCQPVLAQTIAAIEPEAVKGLTVTFDESAAGAA